MSERIPPLADSQLVDRINKGDHDAFRALFTRYNAPLYRHAYRMLHDADLCNDILQDVFLNIWIKRETWTVRTTVIAYLFQAVRNRILDHMSHEKVVDKYRAEIDDFEKNGQCYTEQTVLERELLALIDQNIAELPPRTREVFALNREQHLSYREIAERLSISESTAKKQVHNALRYLRTKLTTLLLSILFLFFLLF